MYKELEGLVVEECGNSRAKGARPKPAGRSGSRGKT